MSDALGLTIKPGLDLLLVELPCRYGTMMPAGIGMMHRIAQDAGLRVDTVDFNILLYRSFHADRLAGGGNPRYAAARAVAGDDPWDPPVTHLWNDPALVDQFVPELDELVAAIAAAPPRVLGLSLNGLSRITARRVAEGIRAHFPTLPVIGGGHDCAHADGARELLAIADHLFIQEADLTLLPVVRELLAGGRPIDHAGVLSRHDTPGRPWRPAPLAQDLDALGFPRYDWADGLDLYRAFDGTLVAPVLWSRGCWWSRCTFCAERFAWRARSPAHVVDELEWFAARGCTRFQCNDSDLIGLSADTLLAIADEIIRRKLEVRIAGQMRCHKRTDEAFFRRLRQAGFVAMRFGVDGWSDRLLRLQRKGSTIAIVERVLTASRAAGLWTSVNIVVGVPGETEEDVDAMIANLIRMSPYIDNVDNFNALELPIGSLYLEEPERHAIRFRDDWKPAEDAPPRVVPGEMWYSEGPFIDEATRRRRLVRVARALARMRVSCSSFLIVRDTALAGQ